MQPLRAKRCPLHHSEPMLFVDDDEPELVKRHRVLNKGVRPDDEVNRSRGNLRLHLTPLACGGCSSEERQPEPRMLEETANRDEVLLGQDLRWRHEGDLKVVFHCDERSHERHDRFARSHVSLQQTVHGLRAFHIADDFGDSFLLIASQLERQHSTRRFTDFICHDHGSRFALDVRLAAPQDHAYLEQKELLEDDTPLCGRPKAVQFFHRCARRGEVHLRERLAAIDQTLPGAHSGRQRIRQFRRKLREGVVHQHPLHLRRERAGLFVDGYDSARVERLVLCLRWIV
jgi:hypothetical protein